MWQVTFLDVCGLIYILRTKNIAFLQYHEINIAIVTKASNNWVLFECTKCKQTLNEVEILKNWFSVWNYFFFVVVPLASLLFFPIKGQSFSLSLSLSLSLSISLFLNLFPFLSLSFQPLNSFFFSNQYLAFNYLFFQTEVLFVDSGNEK